ncbi:MAG TPA: GAF domain-containing protein [Polyangiaceae bacterium]|nr:GAF domain-containing protein [Polyangiaceae bacterium]
MQLQTIPKSVFRLEPPPLWYVTNGDLTVGPVVTGLLMRGVEAGRVPEYCHVRTWHGDWRKLNAVREISALTSKVNAAAPTPDQLAEWRRPVERIRDEMELAHTVTWLSLVTTGAESAMFHYRGRYGRSLVTRAVLGPMSTERLGYPLPESDLILRSARQGKPVFGPPYGPTEDALAMRFASSKGGSGAVAMIPMFVGNELTAMLELSRPGHAFRRSDLQRAEGIVQRALRQRTN